MTFSNLEWEKKLSEVTLRSKLTFPPGVYWTLMIKSLGSRLSGFLQPVKLPGDANGNQARCARCKWMCPFIFHDLCTLQPARWGEDAWLVVTLCQFKARNLEKPDLNAECSRGLCILGHISIWAGFLHFPTPVEWPTACSPSRSGLWPPDPRWRRSKSGALAGFLRKHQMLFLTDWTLPAK